MLQKNHISHCLLAALMVFIAASQPRTAAADETLPDAGDVVAAYLTMRNWMDTMQLPSLDDPAAVLPLKHASGVAVLLRHQGRVIGSSTTTQHQDEPQHMARRALGRALAEAVGDPSVANLPDELRGIIGTRLTLELEVAGQMQPLLGRSYQRAAQDIEPGAEGIAMRRGREWAVLFPAQLRASNTSGSVATRLPSLAVQLGLPATALRTLVQDHGVSVYRFPVVTLAQTQPNALPFETMRGDVLVSSSDVTVQGMARFADDLARYLSSTIDINYPGTDAETEPLRIPMLGDYRPIADRYRPLHAPRLDQALASFALARYSQAPNVDREQAGHARVQANRLLIALAQDTSPQFEALDDPMLAAAVVYACYATAAREPMEPQIRAMQQAALKSLLRALDQPHQHRDGMTLAMMAGALARSLLHDEHGVDAEALSAERIRDALDAAWDHVPEQQHVSLLPWIGWGELDLAQAADAPIAHAEKLKAVRNVLEEARAGREHYPNAPDLHGGFALASALDGRPTAQSTRPAAFLATMLRDEELTSPDEIGIALGRHLHTMRFLMQLSIRDQSTWAYPNATRARGGIRAAPWDSTMPTAAQSMALLTVTETLMSLP